MKAILSVIAIFMLLSGMATPLPKNKQSASFNDEFTRMNAHRQQAGVLVTWNFTNASNCVSFVIERSYDGSYFETIGEASPGDKRNQYKDNGVYPGYLYYRVNAVMQDGTVVHSQVEMVRIVRNG